jgi:hypothetical protein
MPAKKNPVKKRSTNKLVRLLLSMIEPRLNSDPIIALIKKTFDGEKRSAMVNKANINVPKINPNWTAEVKWPNAPTSKSKLLIKSDITPLLANQSDIQQTCEITITGKIHLEIFINLLTVRMGHAVKA